MAGDKPSRLAIFGDVHGNSAAAEAVLQDIDALGLSELYCLGDLAGYGPRPNEVIDLINARNIPTVMGNYDDGVGFDRDDCGCAYRDADERERGQQSLMWTRSVVTNAGKAFLRQLLPEIRFKVNGVRLRMVHGSPRRMNEYLFEDRDSRTLERIARDADCDILLFGHTHVPWQRTIEGVHFVNTGSVGKPKDGDPRGCWVQLAVDQQGTFDVKYHRVEYDVAAMSQAIRQSEGLPDHYATDLDTGGKRALV